MNIKQLGLAAKNLLLENATSLGVDTKFIKTGNPNEIPTGEELSLDFFMKPIKHQHFSDGKSKKEKRALINIYISKHSSDPDDIFDLFLAGDEILKLFEESKSIKCLDGSNEFDGYIDSVMIVNVEITAIYRG